MKKMKLLSSVILCFLALNSCTLSKGYNYSMNTYTGKSDNLALFDSAKLISFKGTIFEFVKKVVTTDSFSLQTGNSYHTMEFMDDGVNVMYLGDSTYFFIDSFSKASKIVKQGSINNKHIGLSMKSIVGFKVGNMGYKSPKDTTINCNKMFFVDTVIKDELGRDTSISKLYFVKSPKFKSHIYSKSPFIGEYNFIGFSFMFYDSQESLLGILEKIQPLSRASKKICNNVLKKVKRYKKTQKKSLY